MMDLSLPGMVGAAFGLMIGWVDFRMLSGILGAKWVEKRRKAGLEHHPNTERFGNWMRFVIFIFTMIAFPVIGYFAGVSLTG